MSNVKRYTFDLDTLIEVPCECSMEECPTGEYVSYEDYKVAKTLANRITHCDNCGADWVNSGLQFMCFCHVVNDLKTKLTGETARADAGEAQLERIRMTLFEPMPQGLDVVQRAARQKVINAIWAAINWQPMYVTSETTTYEPEQTRE